MPDGGFSTACSLPARLDPTLESTDLCGESKLEHSFGRHPGFVLTSSCTLGSANTGLKPATEAMTLQLANNTLTLPGRLVPFTVESGESSHGYEGTVNGAILALGLIPLGNNTFSFDTTGSPVTIRTQRPLTISILR